MRNNVNNHYGRTSVQHPTVYQIPRSEPMEQDNSERKPNLTSEKDCNNPQISAYINISVSGKVKHTEHNMTQHIKIVVNGEVIKKKKQQSRVIQ